MAENIFSVARARRYAAEVSAGGGGTPCGRRGIVHSVGNASRLSEPRKLDGHTGCVNRMAWGPSGRILASVSDDKDILLWRPDEVDSNVGCNGSAAVVKPAAKYPSGHIWNVFGVAWLKEEAIATCAMDCMVRVNTLRPSGEHDAGTSVEYGCHSSRVKHLAALDENSWFTASEDGTVRHFDLRERHLCRAPQCRNVVVSLKDRPEFSSSSNRLLGASERGIHAMLRFQGRLRAAREGAATSAVSLAGGDSSGPAGHGGSTERVADPSSRDEAADARRAPPRPVPSSAPPLAASPVSRPRATAGGGEVGRGRLRRQLWTQEVTAATAGNVHARETIRCERECGSSDKYQMKALAINPVNNNYIAVAASDPLVRIYDRRQFVHHTADRPPPPSANMPCGVMCPLELWRDPFERSKPDESSFRRPISDQFVFPTHACWSPDGSDLAVTYSRDHVYVMPFTNAARSGCSTKFTRTLTSSRHGRNFAASRRWLREGDSETRQLDAWLGSDALEVHQNYEAIVTLQKEANVLLGRGHHSDAICLYTKALALAGPAALDAAAASPSRSPPTSAKPEAEKFSPVVAAVRLPLLCNRSLAYLQRGWRGDCHAAETDAIEGIALHPKHAKAHYRRLSAVRQSGRNGLALRMARKMVRMFPTVKEFGSVESQLRFKLQMTKSRRQQNQSRRQRGGAEGDLGDGGVAEAGGDAGGVGEAAGVGEAVGGDEEDKAIESAIGSKDRGQSNQAAKLVEGSMWIHPSLSAAFRNSFAWWPGWPSLDVNGQGGQNAEERNYSPPSTTVDGDNPSAEPPPITTTGEQTGRRRKRGRQGPLRWLRNRERQERSTRRSSEASSSSPSSESAAGSPSSSSSSLSASEESPIFSGIELGSKLASRGDLPASSGSPQAAAKRPRSGSDSARDFVEGGLVESCGSSRASSGETDSMSEDDAEGGCGADEYVHDNRSRQVLRAKFKAHMKRAASNSCAKPTDGSVTALDELISHVSDYRWRPLGDAERYCGLRNSLTDIKEVAFWGEKVVMAGSDDNKVYVWRRSDGKLINILNAHNKIVNCVQVNPFQSTVATSGIDPHIFLWSPVAEDQFNLDEDVARVVGESAGWSEEPSLECAVQ